MTHPLQWWWDMKLSEQLKWLAKEHNLEILLNCARRAECLEDTIRIGRYKFNEDE
jgi:hypothetical protein